MMPNARKNKDNTNTGYKNMREIFTVDCETDPFLFGRVPKPFLWGAYNGEQYWEFENAKELIEFLEQRHCIAYAHNGGKFDWHFVLKFIPAFAEVLLINGRLSKFTIGGCEFRDSYNILPLPLSAYKKDDFEYWKLEEKHRKKYMQEIKKYMKNDCLYLFEIVQRFIADYGFNLTLAGAALKTWQRIADMKAPKETGKTGREYYEKLNHFYYGGRVQCFKTGIIETEFKVVDINSAYPWAMLKNHPYGKMMYTEYEIPEKNVEQCFIQLKCISKGAFPLRKKNGGLDFPSDDIAQNYFITGWEYIAALNHNAISEIEIIKVIRFTDTIEFSEYINHFYEMKAQAKRENDKAGYINSKLLMNSLYGKFGSNPENYKNNILVPPQHIESAEEDGFKWCGEIGTWYIAEKPLEDDEMQYYDVAVAASITGCVRAYMFESMQKCKGLIYCDTDSIAAHDVGGLQLDGEKLGLWDVEADCDFGAVAGKKLYAFRDKNGTWKKANKGVRLEHSQIVDIARGATVIHANDAPTFSMKKNPHFIQRTVAIKEETL